MSIEFCTAMYQYGNWHDEDCAIAYKAMCMDVKGLNVTFVLVNTDLNWNEVQSYCRAHHTDLASVRNMAENQQVQMLVPASSVVWIGLFRDSWKWSDGKKYSFSHWAASEPNDGNEMCVAANFEDAGRWQDWPCGDERHFICHKLRKVVSKQVIKVRLQYKNSGLNLNDEAVQKDLLVKIKHKLGAQGSDDTFQLSWRNQSDGSIFHKEQKDEL
ncbi:C-type mannose receptor 2-like [Eleginops maclovinus]|uniref:C-type mannose receptor 2-like n=1 Tax=Eleginops maclovinus TaxID=56733 RepID=UPI00307FD5E7